MNTQKKCLDHYFKLKFRLVDYFESIKKQYEIRLLTLESRLKLCIKVRFTDGVYSGCDASSRLWRHTRAYECSWITHKVKDRMQAWPPCRDTKLATRIADRRAYMAKHAVKPNIVLAQCASLCNPKFMEFMVNYSHQLLWHLPFD